MVVLGRKEPRPRVSGHPRWAEVARPRTRRSNARYVMPHAPNPSARDSYRNRPLSSRAFPCTSLPRVERRLVEAWLLQTSLGASSTAIGTTRTAIVGMPRTTRRRHAQVADVKPCGHTCVLWWGKRQRSLAISTLHEPVPTVALVCKKISLSAPTPQCRRSSIVALPSPIASRVPKGFEYSATRSRMYRACAPSAAAGSPRVCRNSLAVYWLCMSAWPLPT
jgi:hypothetical protein